MIFQRLENLTNGIGRDQDAVSGGVGVKYRGGGGGGGEVSGAAVLGGLQNTCICSMSR